MLKGDSQSFDDKWPHMHPVILKLLSQEPVTRDEWQKLFWDVYTTCLWDEETGVDKLHNALKSIILDFMIKAKSIVQKHSDDSALLTAYITVWTRFYEQSQYMPEPFGPLEKALRSSEEQIKIKNKGEKSNLVRNLMLDSWNEHVFCDIRERLQKSAMMLIESERKGMQFSSQLVIGVRQSYVKLCSDPNDHLKIYRNFESAYLETTDSHYTLEAQEYLSEHGVLKYLRYAHKKIKEEEDRALRYLDSSSYPVLKRRVVHVLVTNFLKQILGECLPLIHKNSTEDLNLMFTLVDRDETGVTEMLKVLEKHVVDEGKKHLLESRDVITQDSEKYIEKLLSLFKRFSTLVESSFSDDPRFLTSRDKAFEQVVNDVKIFELDLSIKSKPSMNKIPPESRCPELLANYSDMLLRKTPLSKKLSSEEIESKLKDVLLLLKYVSNKDVFMKYHKAHLTRRLILGTSADNDKEESMVEWLREVGMPADYVNKLARMFQDIKVSEDLNRQFKEGNTNGCGLSDISNIKILNAGAWARRSDRIHVSLPPELEDLIPEVEEFYKKNHNGRKLQWHHLMSNGVITFKTDCGQYDLEVTTFQLSVLFTWNQRPREPISFENLRLATQLPEAELRKTLWSLIAMPKTKRQVLICNPEVSSAKEFTDASVFSINHQYALIKNGKVQKRGRVNLIGRLQLSTERSKEEDNEGILQLRILRTQEAIVKIMKMRKKISHAQLQTELVEMLKNMFLPQKKLIKQQIEWLIENKYMKRDENDINLFIYLV